MRIESAAEAFGDGTAVEQLLRDTQARVTRAAEAIRDGDHFLAEAILDDLAADLCTRPQVSGRAA